MILSVAEEANVPQQVTTVERPINIRNVNKSLNKKGPIENTMEVNIYYQRHRERTEIDVIGGQK